MVAGSLFGRRTLRPFHLFLGFLARALVAGLELGTLVLSPTRLFVTRVPRRIRPRSVQLLGASASGLVGAGRVANRLDFPVDVLSLLLSSGVRASKEEAAVLEIVPPFRFEVLAGGSRLQLVEAGSDADFRALNARDAGAQAAPRNRYLQRYLDTTGRPGDVRISEVISGDPVIVGSVFVHRRM